jgi:hypothetical protein
MAIIAVVIIAWMMNKPAPPGPTTCTTGQTCIPDGGGDPNASGYAYDATCNCVISGCTGTYTLKNGACIKSDNQDIAIKGIVTGESPDFGGCVTASSAADCSSRVQAWPGYKVYSYQDGTQDNCCGYLDYYGVDTDSVKPHQLDNVADNNVTFVKPFTSDDVVNKVVSGPTIMTQVNSSVVSGLSGGITCNGDNCIYACKQDPNCQAITCVGDQCTQYNGPVDYVNNISSGPSGTTTWLKLLPKQFSKSRR